MQIKTKYTVGDMIWFMYKDKALQKEVYKVTVLVTHKTGFAVGDNTTRTQIIYEAYPEGNIGIGFAEEKCFSTRKELLESV